MSLSIYRIADSDDGLMVVAMSMEDAIQAWRWHVKENCDDPDNYPGPESVELVGSLGGGTCVVVSAPAMRLLHTPDKAWATSGKGVLWDVQPEQGGGA